jgi:hypothetical protein
MAGMVGSAGVDAEDQSNDDSRWVTRLDALYLRRRTSECQKWSSNYVFRGDHKMGEQCHAEPHFRIWGMG